MPEGTALLYVDDRGRRHVVELAEADQMETGRIRSYRKPPAYRGQRNFPGLWWSATTRSHVLYESWLERHHIIEADRDPEIVGITGQPFAIRWPEGKRLVIHTPDLFCSAVNRKNVLIDCRPVSKSDEDFRKKCSVTAAVCAEAGWHYRVVGEPDAVWAANLRWLSGYRHPRFADPVLQSVFLENLSREQSLMQLASSAGDPIRTLPVLFHLLWLGQVKADLSQPLDLGTAVSKDRSVLVERV